MNERVAYARPPRKQRKPRLPVELSDVMPVRADTR